MQKKFVRDSARNIVSNWKSAQYGQNMNYFFCLDSCKIEVMETKEEKQYDGTRKRENRKASEKGAAHAWHKS